MTTQISSILRSAFKDKNEPINILSWVVHERYQSNLAKTNAHYYLLQSGPGTKGAWKSEYATVPRNTIILPSYQNHPLEVLPPSVDLDLIVSHHKFGIMQTALQIKRHLKIPLLHMEHTEPTNDNLRAVVPELKKLNGDLNLFITKYSRSTWGYSEDEGRVIEHGIDTQLFKPTGRPHKKQILTVGNDMIGRAEILGFDTFKKIVIDMGLPYKIVGDTEGLSRPAQNVYELSSFYDESLIYFNPSRWSPLPMSLLEAMSCGCAIVTTPNAAISDIIVDGYNGYVSDNENVLFSRLRELLSNEQLALQLGTNARQTILDRFNLDRFVSDWNKTYEEVVQ